MLDTLYDKLQEVSFILKFKPTIPDNDGKIKGNVDADLVLRAILEINDYDKAVIVSSDGDFYSLVQHLYETKWNINRKNTCSLISKLSISKHVYLELSIDIKNNLVKI